jgi:pilus assembly protein CpaB
MRPIAVVLIVVAVIASGLAAFLAQHWMAASTVHEEGPAAVEVLVAGHDIPAGAVLQAGDLRLDKWPQSAVNPRLVTRSGGQDPVPGFVGRVARFAMAEGEPVTQDSVFKQDASGVLAGMLGPGMRAVSVAISNPSAVSGFVTPGDRVDVVLAADVGREEGKRIESGPIAQYAAETILRDVRVLAIDQQIARGRDSAAILGKTATLEVTPKQAEILTAAGLMGQLSLVLRSIAQAPANPVDKDSAGKDALAKDPFTADTEVSKALEAVHAGAFNAAPETPNAKRGPTVRVNRGGAISTTGF